MGASSRSVATVREHCLRYLGQPACARRREFRSPAASGAPAQVDGSPPAAQGAQASTPTRSSTGIGDATTSPERSAHVSPAKVLGSCATLTANTANHTASDDERLLFEAARRHADIPSALSRPRMTSRAADRLSRDKAQGEAALRLRRVQARSGLRARTPCAACVPLGGAAAPRPGRLGRWNASSACHLDSSRCRISDARNIGLATTEGFLLTATGATAHHTERVHRRSHMARKRRRRGKAAGDRGRAHGIALIEQTAFRARSPCSPTRCPGTLETSRLHDPQKARGTARALRRRRGDLVHRGRHDTGVALGGTRPTAMMNPAWAKPPFSAYRR
jgi:hypothetical protein